MAKYKTPRIHYNPSLLPNDEKPGKIISKLLSEEFYKSVDTKEIVELAEKVKKYETVSKIKVREELYEKFKEWKESNEEIKQVPIKYVLSALLELYLGKKSNNKELSKNESTDNKVKTTRTENKNKVQSDVKKPAEVELHTQNVDELIELLGPKIKKIIDARVFGVLIKYSFLNFDQVFKTEVFEKIIKYIYYIDEKYDKIVETLEYAKIILLNATPNPQEILDKARENSRLYYNILSRCINPWTKEPCYMSCGGVFSSIAEYFLYHRNLKLKYTLGGESKSYNLIPLIMKYDTVVFDNNPYNGKTTELGFLYVSRIEQYLADTAWNIKMFIPSANNKYQVLPNIYRFSGKPCYYKYNGKKIELGEKILEFFNV